MAMGVAYSEWKEDPQLELFGVIGSDFVLSRDGGIEFAISQTSIQLPARMIRFLGLNIQLLLIFQSY